MLARCVATLKPPPELTLSQWADRYRMLSAESSAEPGRWHTDKAPYQREIMDAIGDAHIRRVVIMCAAQLGKTELLLNILGYFMAYAPAPILVMQPTLDMGQTFSKDRLAPMIRDTPVLRGLVDVKSRYAGNTILKKNFPGGHITIVGANMVVTSDSLTKIVSDSSNIANTFDEMSKDNEIQAKNANAIRSEIENISQVVQSNTATAQQTAASTEVLSEQAAALKDMTGRFKVDY